MATAPVALPQQGVASREFYFAGHVPSHLRAFNGDSFFSLESQRWMASCTGERINFDRFCSLGLPWQRPQHYGFEATEQFFKRHCHPDLPDRNVLFSFVTHYRSSFANRWFPFIHPTLFEYTVKAAYDHQQSIYSPHIPSATACVFAFMAFMSSSSSMTKPPMNIDGQKYGHEAQYLLSKIFDSTATLDGIQTLLMITLDRSLRFGDTSFIEVLFSAATRFIFTLRGNQYKHILQDMNVFNVHCRFLFWLAYVFDKEMSTRTTRPPSICDDYCDLTFPSKEEIAIEFDLPISQTEGDTLLLLFPTDLGLSLNQSRIYTSLYSPRALQMSDAELLKAIRELDDAMDEWYNRLQLQHTFDRLLSGGIASHEEVAHRFTFIRLQRYCCIAAIHQMSTGCAAWMEDQSWRLVGINLSLEVAMNASRSLLREFLEVLDWAQRDSFWVFYILSPVMTVFCSILRSPEGPKANDDLALLETVAERFRVLADTQEFLGSFQDGKLLKDFISELQRLAKCAILYRGSYALA
ncbi:hypothetical protein BDV37DRAFT_279903 [Aspergillus pseudonomiae]|uniref:Xylanolytic transcriptional activator regulatory domain-containing protein n=1 Tax=Aspergillus pseudonomiae TaxID=1506151 RepID=A0A5N7DMT3_9EURO|nr:uncharacterized protein BDV37DRAFT_279903 [Aspergillus pseudonomiae]KAE8407369.1 hypothetical protein BDV37DRAFT_279903 [Aspergillus pseudonomiae]